MDSELSSKRDRSRSRDRAKPRRHTGTFEREGRRVTYDRDPRFDGDRRAPASTLLQLADIDRGRAEAGGPHKRPQKRNMMELKHDDIPTGLVAMAQKVVSQLCDVSDVGFVRSELPANIQGLEDTFSMPNMLLHESPLQAAELLVKCMSQLSPQAPICAALLAAFYTDDRDDRRYNCRTLVGNVVDELQTILLNSLKSSDVRRAKLSLRSLAMLARQRLVPIPGPSGLGRVLSILLDVGQTATESAHVATYLLCATLVWSADELIAGWSEELHLTEQFLEVYSQNRRCPYDIQGISAVFHSDIHGEGATSGSCSDTIDDMVTAAREAVNRALKHSYVLSDLIIQPWSETQQPSAPDLTLDILIPGLVSALSESRVTMWNIPILTLFEDDPDDPAIPEAARACGRLVNPDKAIFRDYVQDIIHFFNPIVRDDGTMIGSVATLAKHLLALRRLLPDEVSDGVHAYVIVEIVLGMLVQQPNRGLAFPFRITFDLCQEEIQLSEKWATSCHVPTALAYGTQYLFLFAAALDALSLRQICDWVAMHLSNYKLVWPFWASWEEEFLQTEHGHAQEQFLRILTDKLALHIQRDQLMSQLRPFLHPYIPVTRSFSLYFPPEEELPEGFHPVSDSLANIAHELKIKVQGRDDYEDVQEYLDQDHGLDSESDTWRAHLLMHTVLHVGHKTITHTSSFIDKYRLLLQEYAFASDENQQRMLEAVAEVWAPSPWHVNFVIDALMRRAVLTPSIVADWALQDSHLSSLTTETWPLEWIKTVINRTLDNVRAAVKRGTLDPAAVIATRVASGGAGPKTGESDTLGESVMEEKGNGNNETTEGEGDAEVDAGQYAVDLARRVSSMSVTRLASVMREQAVALAQMDGESGDPSTAHYQNALDPLYNACFSLLLWVLRSYGGAQEEISYTAGCPVALLEYDHITACITSTALPVLETLWQAFLADGSSGTSTSS